MNNVRERVLMFVNVFLRERRCSEMYIYIYIYMPTAMHMCSAALDGCANRNPEADAKTEGQKSLTM